MSLVYSSFPVNSREKCGKYYASKYRSDFKIPGVIYGISYLKNIFIYKNDLVVLSKHIKNGVNIFQCTLDDEKFFVIVKEIQDHPYKQEIIHLDLQRVELTSFVSINIFFNFINLESSLGFKNGGVLIKHLSSVLIKCKVEDIPSYIDVDLSNLSINQVIYLSDLKFDSRFIIPALNYKSKVLVANITGSRIFEDKKDNIKDLKDLKDVKDVKDVRDFKDIDKNKDRTKDKNKDSAKKK